ncbi:hypothetical protein BJ322DRAFT_527941 [Thelephora terrestris]|uniref:Uncharacterized protein n=1 Tax=Thelephora terrestris TaxID=56493 RepID=A0A9P6HM08_9AGAM|nr:hypothetical protein BJ322DRAFT_527941 [Thelephora terrestris]
MLLKAWDDRKSALRSNYYEMLKVAIEPVFRFPRIEELGTKARDVLGAIACFNFQSGIMERQLEGIFHGTDGVSEVVDVLCKFSLVYRQGGVLKMLWPLRFYFLKSMIVYTETEEIIKWGPECMPAPAWIPVYTQGPPDDWLFTPRDTDCAHRRSCPVVFTRGPSGNSSSHTNPHLETPPRKWKWIRRLQQIVKRKLLALFGRKTVPAVLVDGQDPENIPYTALQDNYTNIPPVITQEDRANTLPTTAQEDPANRLPAATQEESANLSLIASQQRVSPAPAAYDVD